MCLAIPGQVVELLPGPNALAVVNVVGVRRRIDLGLLEDDPAVPGDWVLIHVGFAMSKISESDAREQMELLRMLGECEAAVEEVTGYGLGTEDEAGGPT
jgi:hydrogenase expression/formation protein HypC